MPLEFVLLGALLDDLFSQLEDLIKQARDAGNAVLMQAGVEAQRVVENVRYAYLDMLDKTIRELDQLVRSTIDQLESMVDEVVREAFESLDDITDKAQLITNTLPFADEDPQLKDHTPHSIVPSQQGDNVQIAFEGNFPRAAEEGFEPYLLLMRDIRDVEPIRVLSAENTTLSLKFQVPLQDLLDRSELLTDRQDSSVIVRLVMPTSDGESTFKAIIGLLPDSPGKITLKHTEQKPVIDPYWLPHKKYSQYSDTDDITRQYELKTLDPSYHVVPGHFLLHPQPFDGNHLPGGKNEGVWGWQLKHEEGDRVIWEVETKGHLVMPGRIDFEVTFYQERTRYVPDPKEEAVDLRWGSSSNLFDYPVGTWEVIFYPFTGEEPIHYGKPTSDKYLKIQNEAGRFKIVAADPAKLEWPIT